MSAKNSPDALLRWKSCWAGTREGNTEGTVTHMYHTFILSVKSLHCARHCARCSGYRDWVERSFSTILVIYLPNSILFLVMVSDFGGEESTLYAGSMQSWGISPQGSGSTYDHGLSQLLYHIPMTTVIYSRDAYDLTWSSQSEPQTCKKIF